MKVHALLMLVAITLTFLLGCDDENGPSVPSAQMELVEAPTFLPSNADQFHTYAIRVSGATPDSILCEVTRAEGEAAGSFALFDDGNTRDLSGHSFASASSGDVIAGNGVYTRGINGLLLAAGGNVTYTFRFVPHGGTNLPAAQTLTVEFMFVEPCVITSFVTDSVFSQCFDPTVFEMRISPYPGDEVECVKGQLNREYMRMISTIEEFEFTHVSDDLWTYTLDPTLFRFVSYPTDAVVHYWFTYLVSTRFGTGCGTMVGLDSYPNHVPVLSNSTLPDTAYRPSTSGDSNLIVVTVDMDDCELQGATDFYGLEFQTRRDSLDWGRAPNFYLRNDGLEPDALAGDDTYSSWLVITHNSELLNNLYYFRFYALDPGTWSQDSSEFLLDSIRIIQPGAVVSGNELNPSELGIHVWNESPLQPYNWTDASDRRDLSFSCGFAAALNTTIGSP